MSEDLQQELLDIACWTPIKLVIESEFDDKKMPVFGACLYVGEDQSTTEYNTVGESLVDEAIRAVIQHYRADEAKAHDGEHRLYPEYQEARY